MSLQYFDYGTEFASVSVDDTNNRLLAGDTAGNIWQLEVIDRVDDEGTAISWEIESKDFTLQTRAHFPRWRKYDVDASADNCTATGEVILDGTSHQSHSLTQDRRTKRRLVTTGNGQTESIKISGSGTVEIFAVESQ
jgi:hypothetical protein